MKKIKFIPFLFIALALLTTSCAIDDDGALVPIDIITKTVSFNETEVIVPASATPYDLAVYVDQAFGTDALVEYTINDVNGGATIDGGNTVGNIPVDVSEDGAIYLVTLTRVSVLNRPNDVKAVIGEMNTIKVIVLTIPDANPNALQVIMTWDNPAGNDLDLWLTDDPPSTGFEVSQSVSPLEQVSFSNGYGDGTYNILVRDWSSVDAVVNVLVAVVHPDGTVETFSDSIDAGTGFNYFVKFDKVGSEYTMTQVPAEPVF